MHHAFGSGVADSYSAMRVRFGEQVGCRHDSTDQIWVSIAFQRWLL